MRRLLAALLALSFLYPAGAAEPVKPAPSLSSKFRIDPTYEDGRLLKLKTPRGVTKYEYGRDGKLTRKILPKGVTVDYYYDRSGRLVESRFSTGVVRTSDYDRQGRLAQIVGSDGYVLNASGPMGKRTIVITGPKDYRVDLTPMINMARKSYASKMMGKNRPRPMVSSAGGSNSGCEETWNGDTTCDGFDGGEYGGGGDYGEGGYDDWGAAEDDAGYGEAEDAVADGEDDYDYDYDYDSGYGEAEDAVADGEDDDSGYGEAEDEDGADAGEPPGADTGGPWPPQRSSSPGDNGFLRCMVDCDRADVYMKQYCRVAAANKPVCDQVALRTYFSCDRRCRYENY